MSKNPADPKSDFHAKCKAGKLKITPQRTLIYESLLNDAGHPSVDEVFKKVKKKIPNISFDTVNRTLLSFVEIGLLGLTRGIDRCRRFDTVTQNHHHFQCLKCSSIIDFYDDGYDRLKIPAGIEKKFTVTGKKVVLEGICSKCRGK